MRQWFLAWMNSLTAVELGLVFCGLFFLITLIGIPLFHPHIRRAVHGKRQVNDVVIFVAANFGLVYAVLLGLLVVATFQITKDPAGSRCHGSFESGDDVSQHRCIPGAVAK